MNFWLVGGFLVLLSLYLLFGQGRWSTRSKHFKLYKVMIDLNKAPDFSIEGFVGKTVPGYLTYVRPGIAFRRGLKAYEIVGYLKNFRKRFVPENFVTNKAFKDRIHSIAAREIPEFVRTQAKTLGTGEIKLMDDRIALQPAAAGNEHCLGTYRVENGQVAGYTPNPDFRFCSTQGPLELVESIRAVLYSEITGTKVPRQTT